MNSIDENNNEILACALLKAAKDNNRDFPDDIEDNISLKLIKKIAELEISKLEYDKEATELSIWISILGIQLAAFGIGFSEILFGVNLFGNISSWWYYYIISGVIIIYVGIYIARKMELKQRKVYKRKLERFNFFQHIILKIERRI